MVERTFNTVGRRVSMETALLNRSPLVSASDGRTRLASVVGVVECRFNEELASPTKSKTMGPVVVKFELE